MIKKKGKKSSAKKTAKRRTSKKQLDATKVRQEIAGIVKSGAKDITEAVMDQAMHGELGPAKYLFEMAGVYPPSTDGDVSSTKEEESLAKTLLDRLNIPDHPVVADQEDEEFMVIAAKPDASGETEKDGTEDEAKEKDPVET